MSFSIKKDNSLLEIQKVKGNLVIRLSFSEKEKGRKEKKKIKVFVFGIPYGRNEILTLKNNKWIPFVSKEENLKEENLKEENISSRLIDIIQSEIIKESKKERKYEFDEERFVEAIIFDLLNDRSLFWVPGEGKYEFYDDKLYSTEKGWQYEYEMPRAKGIERNQLLLVQRTLPDVSTSSSTFKVPEFPKNLPKLPIQSKEEDFLSKFSNLKI